MMERAFWLVWSQIPGIGPILLKRLQGHFGTLAVAWESPSKALRQVEGFGSQMVAKISAYRQQFHPEQVLEEHLQRNPDFWTPADAEYPRLLLEIPDSPPVLYYRGQVCSEENQGSLPTVAIVGTREPTDYGKRWTRKISSLLARQGFTIVSGMAQGIDTDVHRGCLEVGGRTIAVFGTGVDMIYPPQNKGLYQQIVDRGLVLSEYPAGTQPDRSHFPRRNRIIAGLSRAVLVMEAPSQSGALITARLANDFGRDIYILPGRLDDRNSTGCLGLLSKGAHVIISEGYLLEMLGAMPQLDAPVQQLSLFSQTPMPVPEMEEEKLKVLISVPTEPTPLDLIVEQAGLAASVVSSALLELELLGLVSQLPGMRYQRH